MMKLSRSVVYAVQATIQLAADESGEPVPCSQLASQGRMPERFLLQVLRHLVTHGVLISTRGVEGGYALERPASEISLLQVIESIDGPLALAWPDMPEGDASGGAKIRDLLARISDQCRKQLAEVKISDLAGASRR